MSIRFIMVGGFLGAGKTTTMARLARHYTDQGLRVGIVTNDQADQLVDTESLRAQGFDVGEVAGACFCCKFNDLMETVGKLQHGIKPDIILTEPVGSCTDLVATVIQPIKQLYGEQFELAPYAVILKPSHGSKVLRGERRSGFSPKAAYILKKQLEEADVILINRIDELTEREVEELVRLVRQHVPGTPVLRVSARTGTGFDSLIELLAQQGDFGRRLLDIDYDVYAEGEAELGWLNAGVELRSQQEFDLDQVLLKIVQQLRELLAGENAEAAHLKTIGLWEGFFGVANLISSDTLPELSLPAHCTTREADVIVNARVACDPDRLRELVEQAVAEVSREMGLSSQVTQVQSFRPGRPMPTHRLADAV